MSQKRELGVHKLIKKVLLIGALLSAFLVLRMTVGGETGIATDRMTAVSDGWYYIKDGEWVYVTLPADIVLEDRNELVLYHSIPNRRYGGMTLTTKGAGYRLKVSVDDYDLFEYRDEGFPRNRQMADKLSCDAVLPLDVARRTLALTYENVEGGRYQLPMVYIGSSSAVLWYHCMDEAASFLIVFALTVLSVFVVAVSGVMWHEKMLDRRLLDLVGFLVMCSIWCITDSSIVQHLTGLSPLTNVVSFYAFMLMSVPMLYFVRSTVGMEKYRVLDLVIGAFYLNALLQGCLNVFAGIEFIDMLFITHLLLLVGILCTVTAIRQEYKISGNPELYMIKRAFTVVATGGVLALMLYWVLEITYYELIYEVGVLIFMIDLLNHVTGIMVESLRLRAESEANDRMLKEDSLTGFGNRYAFEEYLTEFEEFGDICENAVLMFLDINRLKEVNDRAGHIAGDELIIAASRCIERAFAQDGKCFRTHGGEFCVVFLNPDRTKEEWNEALNREVRRYNQESRNRLTLAKGLSYLREDGRAKSISDWKYEADQQLQANKGWRRIEPESD